MSLSKLRTNYSLVGAGTRPKGRATLIARPRLKNWRGATAVARPRHDSRAGRKDASAGLSYQAALRTTAVEVSRFVVLGRLLLISQKASWFWLGVLRRRFWDNIRFLSSVILNKLNGKPVLEEEELADQRHAVDAEEFRKLLEKLGGVMIKVGQQLAQRVDLLPPAYCDELKEMVDVIRGDKGIAEEDVRAAIKRQTRRPLGETFCEFDFKNPVGKASVACVYEAYLLTGERVAVKVRRPNIKKKFAADLDAIAFILRAAEFLTILRPRLTESFRTELKESLLEELDFRIEARYQELFRRYHDRRKKLNVTAPRVFYGPSGEEVLVSEYVHGFKVQDIVQAIHDGDEEYLAKIHRAGIDPKIVAKRLIRSRYYSFHECPLFHGDPHPGNVLVQPNNRIVMIDFGACGVFSERERNLMWQLNAYYAREDAGGMVNMVISIMEPVQPPVRNWDQFRKELLDVWWKGFYGIKSKHSEQWERTSFRLWLGFFQLIRKHQIAVPRNMVRMIRATLLYDTLAANLHGKINVFKEFQKYSHDVARRTRYRIEESAIRQLLTGPDDSAFLKLQQIADVGNGLLFRLQKFLDDPEFNFAEMAGKMYSAVRSFVRMFLVCGGLAVTGMVIAVTYKIFDNSGAVWTPLVLVKSSVEGLWNPRGWGFQSIVTLWLISTIVVVFLYGRRVYLRFGDADD